MTATAEAPLIDVPAELPAYVTFAPRPNQHERYDQQSAFYHSQAQGVAWLLGGNGAGTTEVAMAKVAKFLLETPPPRKDTPFWIISNTYQQVCKACWKEKLNPRGGHGHIPEQEIDWDRIRWFKPNQGWPFEVPLRDWPGRPDRNWSIVFKSYDQGRQNMQAEAIGGFCFVEQFPWGLLEEVLRGCREYAFPGSKMCEYTPIDPNLSIEIEEMIQEDRLPPNWEVYHANTECAMEAGHVTQEWFDEFFGMVSDEMRDVRMRGLFASYQGAIYKGFNPAVHLVGDETITFPLNVHYRRSIDWGAGPDNAFCCLWGYRNGLGQWFIFNEYYSTNLEFTTVDHLCEVQNQWPWPKRSPYYGCTYADPSSPDNIRIAGKLSQYCEHDIKGEPLYDPLEMMPGANAVIEGIEHVQWLLKPTLRVVDPDTGTVTMQPRLFIHRQNCPKLARQMRTYRWVQGSDRGDNPRDARREPLKKNDHAVDALRYLVFSEAMHEGTTPSAMARQRRDVRRGVHLDRGAV